MKTYFFALSMVVLFSSCKKDKTLTVASDQLPPVTQTGANTFGCLINGNIYIPKGYDGSGKPNPHIIYDLDSNGFPFLYIQTNQFVNAASNAGVAITFKNINHLGYYSLPVQMVASIGSNSILGNCGVSSFDSNVQTWGGGEITRLDVSNHIISGLFNFKLKNPSCDTVYITDGRFDIKF